jgi:hypothetical protein
VSVLGKKETWIGVALTIVALVVFTKFVQPRMGGSS